MGRDITRLGPSPASISRFTQVNDYKLYSILLHAAGLGYGQQQQIQLLQRFGHMRQKATCFPAVLGRNARGAVGREEIFIYQELFQLSD